MLFDKFERFFVLRWICFLENLEVPTSVSYHFDKSASRVVVLLVFLEVSCEKVNLFGEHSYLHLLRTSVRLVNLVLFDDCLLFLR